MNYRSMTTDELITRGLDADRDTLTRELAERVDAAIQSRNARISELEAELALEDVLYDA